MPPGPIGPEAFENLIFPLFRIITAIGVVAAVYFAYKLYRETDKGWYWAGLFFSAFFFAVSQWIFVLDPVFGFRGISLALRDSSELLAIFLFAISCYGIYSTMHKIRKRVE
ncbi:MAG: hypothetical protein WC506_00720 [Candidatus Micrarchaeia archaeon]